MVDIHKIRLKFPDLNDWMLNQPLKIIEQHSKWDDLLQVCDYFVKHPRPNVYIRELPIPVHTKFIEANQGILRELLEILLPERTIDPHGQSFNARFGLKDKPAGVRVRLLEEQLEWQYKIRIDDLALPIDQMARLLREHIKPRNVLIVENLINFLTLPKITNGIGIFGGGFAIHLLKDVGWLNHCEIIYWGDIDTHGFEILSDLRGLFSHVRSIMMDRETLETYKRYVGKDAPNRSKRFNYLTEAEMLVVQEILTHNWRLEQEHIPQDYVEKRLKECL